MVLLQGTYGVTSRFLYSDGTQRSVSLGEDIFRSLLEVKNSRFAQQVICCGLPSVWTSTRQNCLQGGYRSKSLCSKDEQYACSQDSASK